MPSGATGGEFERRHVTVYIASVNYQVIPSGGSLYLLVKLI